MAIINQNTPELEKITVANSPETEDVNSSNKASETTEVDQESAGVKRFSRFFEFITGRRSKSANKYVSSKAEIKIRVLILIVVIIAIVAGGANIVSNGIDRMLLAEKLIEKQLEIDLIVEQTDSAIKKDNDWESAYKHYVDSVMIGMELIDRVHMTYAAVFDENLQNLSARSPSYDGHPFKPDIFPEFIEAVKSNESGKLVLPFTPAGSKERDMYLHFRWLPSDSALPHRLLVVVAISKYTINTRISMWVQIAASFLVIAIFIITIFAWRKRATESLNRVLEETVAQRTAELKEQTASAQKASMAKGDFLSNMSHEMRTPMNAIIGMTAIAKNSGDLVRKDYCLNRIEGASTHLLRVINDILDMSKIEADKFELFFEKFNFERVLQKVANVIAFNVDEKHQNFTVNIDKNIPIHLIGDDQRITQVITNLMSNAVKFTPEGGSIHLNTHLLEENNNICTIKVEVRDTGIGISPEQQARLFSSFMQAESSTTRKFGGTGLGLAISKHIIEMMNGKIWIESELGKGSTFAFIIKAERAAETSDGLLEMGINWKNMSVLVVDNALYTREYFADIMQRFGSKCNVAASGEEACKIIDRHGPYNIYFVDWRMPGMDTIELVRHINSQEGSKSVVVMVSASEWNEIGDVAKSIGISRFLSKPLFPSNIADCINECLGSDNVISGNNEITYKGLFKGHRIILAEDVEINREIILSLLEPTELIIDTAENGLVAIELFCKNYDKYSLILMDIQMPEMDGYGATREIRTLNLQWAQEIPIIALTANVFKEDIEKCIACGMNDHLGKPIDYNKMISKLCEYLLAGNLNTRVKQAEKTSVDNR